MNDPKKYLSILGVLTIVCFALALMLGATFKSPAAVLQGLLTHDFDIWQYRMPRAILAVLVGAALALSGTIIQGIIHNPLASPDILSINHGASLAAVATLMMMPGTPVWALPVAACVGAAVAYLVLMLVAGRQAGPLQMALIGVALSAFYAAMTDYLMLSHPLEVNTAMVWLTGSLWGRTWSFVEMGAPLLILLLPLAVVFCLIMFVLFLIPDKEDEEELYEDYDEDEYDEEAGDVEVMSADDDHVAFLEGFPVPPLPGQSLPPSPRARRASPVSGTDGFEDGPATAVGLLDDVDSKDDETGFADSAASAGSPDSAGPDEVSGLTRPGADAATALPTFTLGLKADTASDKGTDTATEAPQEGKDD